MRITITLIGRPRALAATIVETLLSKTPMEMDSEGGSSASRRSGGGSRGDREFSECKQLVSQFKLRRKAHRYFSDGTGKASPKVQQEGK
ncbi:hypothetical protein PIB30_028544 [Stylosanthes scabra]|uniref:Uncharacterized protein n=1 Tax=Stylosanthes scabra TaxID=79078 RepID=A0ABU6SCI1_9FABA|nr:hypothetical protein [Stylosanthes scabra]